MVDFSELCLAPKNRTRFLTTIMSSAGTADAFEGNDVISIKPEGSAGFVDAYRVSAPRNPKPLPTKFEHFGHERKVVQCACGVQRLDDFVRRPHFHEVTAAKSYMWLTHGLLKIGLSRT